MTGKVPPDVAYTAGLLHDIGKVVLDHYHHNPHWHFYRHLHSGNGDWAHQEKEIFGLCHTEAGERLARYWQLSESLIETIRFHHNPDRATISPLLVQLVHLADNLIFGLMMAEDFEGNGTQPSRLVLANSGLNWEKLNAIAEGVSHEIFNA